MWYALQMTVIIAVLFSNVHWGWTPNPYLAALIAIGAALIATVVASTVLDYVRARR